MSSNHISEKLKKKLPSKNIFISLFLMFITLTFGAIVALANENMVIVEAEVLNVRYGPGLSHEILTQVEENDRLFLLGEENKWYKVRLGNDYVGWVASWLVDSNEINSKEQQYSKVSGESVNIRQFATTDSEIIGTVYRDTELQVLYQDGDWYQILYMGRVAWIHSDYIDLIDAPAVEMIETNDAFASDVTLVVIGDATATNIRNQPSLDGEAIYTAHAGEQFEYIESIDNWFHIRLNETETGYVSDTVASIPMTQTEIDETNSIATASNVAQYARTATNLSEATIVIDAGHGGYDPGAVSADESILEKDVTLSTALLLRDRLSDAGTNVILARAQDDFVSLDGRVQTAHNNQADVFISLHYDAIEDPNSVSGTTTYYYSEANLELANTVNRYLAQHGPLANNGVRFGDYYVLRANRQPSILLELGYMNNSTDIQHIDSHAYQSTVVEAIYLALREYYSQ